MTAAAPVSAPPAVLPSDATHDAEPAVLRCRSTADLLAALPFVAGVTATDSLFLVHFSGSRAYRSIRADLPERDSPESLIGYVDAVIELLRETGAGPDGPAVVITCAESFTEAGGVPRRNLARMLRRRFRREGWGLRDLAVIASDGWASLLVPRSPARRRPLSEISASPVLERIADLSIEPKALDRQGRLPDADPERAAAVLARLAELDGRAELSAVVDREHAGAPAWAYGIARVAGACIDGADPPDPRLLARIIRASETQDHWLVLLLATIAPPGIVIGVLEELEPGRFVGAPIDIDDGLGEQPEQEPVVGWSVRRLLVALASEPPDLGRLQRSVSMLEDVAAHAPAARRTGLLTLLAWAWWMRALSSAAGRVLSEALEIDPGHELALMIGRVIEHPPGWALDASTGSPE